MTPVCPVATENSADTGIGDCARGDRSRSGGRSGRSRKAGCATKIPEERQFDVGGAAVRHRQGGALPHPPAAGAFDTARPAKSTTTVTVVGERAQVRLAHAANGGPLAVTESQQTPTASMVQVSAVRAAPPSTASPDVVDVVTGVLATALAAIVQPGPGAPSDPPALLAVMAWARREIPAHPRYRDARGHAARNGTGSRHGQRAARVGGRRLSRVVAPL